MSPPPSPRYAGYSGTYLLPAALSPTAAATNSARVEAHQLLKADPDAAASLLDRMLFETGADHGPADQMAALHLDASVAALRRGEPALALASLDGVVEHARLAHHARLNRLRAWLELDLPDDTAGRVATEVEFLQSGPLALEARLALAVVQARTGDTADCRATVAALDDVSLPEGLDLLHQHNAGVMLLEANDVAGALRRFAAAQELAPSSTPWVRAVLTLNRGTAAGVQAQQTDGDAERAALFSEAGRLLDEATVTLGRLRAPDRLLGVCRRNRGLVRLFGGWRSGDPDAVEAALCDHWSALGLFVRRPECRRLAGSQWSTLGLCYRLRRSPGDDVRAQLCFDRAEESLGVTGDPVALAERDLAESALRRGVDPEAALDLALPAAIFLDAFRFRLAGAEARHRWAAGATDDAFHDALDAAGQAGRPALAAALVVWRRFGGAAQFEREGPLPVTEAEASVLTPPPQIRGVAGVLAPYVELAARRYAVTVSELVAPTTIDLLA